MNTSALRRPISTAFAAATLLALPACDPPDRGEFDGFPPIEEGGSSSTPDDTPDSDPDSDPDSVDRGESGPGAPGTDGGAEDPEPGDTGADGADTGTPEPGDTGDPEPEPSTVCGKPRGFPRNDAIPEPVFADEVNVNSTIVIDEPGIYDFENVLHVWTGSGQCNQTENQPYILRIASSDVTLRNFAYRNAPDGIHIGTANDGQGYSYGDSIDNIVLDNVTGWACEDALTTQYGVEHITITNSTFLANPNPDYQDKLLQLNFGDATIEDSTFVGSDTCVMFKGGQDVSIRNSRFIDCNRAINGSTIHGIVGNISTDHSTLSTECNEAYHEELAWKFWGGFSVATSYADVDGHSVNDLVYDNGVHEAQDGGVQIVECDPEIVQAGLCGPVHGD